MTKKEGPGFLLNKFDQALLEEGGKVQGEFNTGPASAQNEIAGSTVFHALSGAQRITAT